MRVRVIGGVSDLARDYRSIPADFAAGTPRALKRSADFGQQLARSLARAKAGPHGKAFYKRITAELVGPTTAEFGPSGSPKTEFVGVGYRHGTNTDLETSAKPAGDELAAEVRRLLGNLSW